ncbi:MAG TPA: DUF5317 domain-containing protein [Desulfitobacteriaceae bacterium]|nr:DUF5317 domain-containing protein [Desulfitobacteriaceae bacterium]
MLIETVILAIVVSLIDGGRIGRLGWLDLRGLWLIPSAWAIQIVVYWAAVKGMGMGPEWVSPVLDTASYFLLLIFAGNNWYLPGMRILALGIFLNTLVIAVNGGMMPVDSFYLPEASRQALLAGQGTHGLLTPATHLSLLADRIFISIAGFIKQLISLGDILIDAGSFLLIYKTMMR